MHPIGNTTDRYFHPRKSGKQGLKYSTADFAVQPAHTIYRARAVKCKVGHIEWLIAIAGYAAVSQRDHLIFPDTQLFCVVPEIVNEKAWRKTVETRLHGRMRGEQVAGPRCAERQFKGLLVMDHEVAGALKDCKSCMTLVEMAYRAINSHHFQQPPAPDAKSDFLLQTNLLTATIKLTGDAPVARIVQRVVAVEQKQRAPAYRHMPDTQVQQPSWKFDGSTQPLSLVIS